MENGYIFVNVQGESVRKHRLVWEEAHGPIPKGMVIHHKNEIRIDNRIENLTIVSPGEHASIHAGHYRQIKGDTETHKRCVRCGEIKIRSDFYQSKQHVDELIPYCKPCKRIRNRMSNLIRLAKRLWPNVKVTGPLGERD